MASQLHVQRTDLIVVGSGAAGLSAALAARMQGLSVVVLEHMEQIGGTSARSSGTVWVPGNHLLGELVAEQDRRAAESYLDALVGRRGLWMRFLDAAPAMIEAFIGEGLDFRPFAMAVDYRQELPGAGQGGRPLEPQAFDGRLLGADFDRLASPLPELMVFGGMMVTRAEAGSLLRFDRSAKSLMLALSLSWRYARDRLRHRRGTRLVLGNALVARLVYALQRRNVEIRTGVRVEKILVSDGRASGVQAVIEGQQVIVEAARGVILAGGGFPSNQMLREEHLPRPTPQFTPASPGCDGSSIGLGLAAGAALGPDTFDNAQWFPSSVMTRTDGSQAVYPHIVLDRAKPGCLVVDQSGQRFTNEAVSYHEFVRGCIGHMPRDPPFRLFSSPRGLSSQDMAWGSYARERPF